MRITSVAGFGIWLMTQISRFTIDIKTVTLHFALYRRKPRQRVALWKIRDDLLFMQKATIDCLPISKDHSQITTQCLLRFRFRCIEHFIHSEFESIIWQYLVHRITLIMFFELSSII